jgi:hypothetical protein
MRLLLKFFRLLGTVNLRLGCRSQQLIRPREVPGVDVNFRLLEKAPR